MILDIYTYTYAYLDMLFFIGLNDEVKTRISPLASSKACCSLRPTTDSGGMLWNNNSLKLLQDDQ